MDDPGNPMTASDWHYDRRLDARGFRCPLPVLKARKALVAMRTGERLLVETDDPVAAIDMPHFCREAGHTLLAGMRHATGMRFLIARGP